MISCIQYTNTHNIPPTPLTTGVGFLFVNLIHIVVIDKVKIIYFFITMIKYRNETKRKQLRVY